MRIPRELFLKWLDPKDTKNKGLSFTLIDHCILVAEDQNRKIKGCTVFEPRAVNKDFVDRLERRMKNPEMEGSKFLMFVPEFIKPKAENLTKDLKLPISIQATSFVKLDEKEGNFFLRPRLRVINVDDSPVLLKFLKNALGNMGFIDVIAQVSNSSEATETILKFKPDLVTMDIQMPGKTGVEVVQEVLELINLPILMISSLNLEEGSLVFSALNAGAFDYLQKPKLEDKSQFEQELREKILLAVDGKVAKSNPPKQPISISSEVVSYPDNLLWCIGSSTGGTQALTRIFTSMPNKIPPTIVVQHIPPVFSKSFAESLNQLCPFRVKEVEDGEILMPNHVYIAAGGMQLGIDQRLGKIHLLLKDDPPENRFKPSVDYMFKQVAKLQNISVVAGILTGMGKDGAAGLLTLKKIGARTFAQDEESSAVFGMPRAAIEIGAADSVEPLDNIAHAMLLKSQKARKAS